LLLSTQQRTIVDNFSTGATSEVNFTGIHFLISDLDDFFIQYSTNVSEPTAGLSNSGNPTLAAPESRDFNIRVDMEIYQ
jgi:hypothetical protein